MQVLCVHCVVVLYHGGILPFAFHDNFLRVFVTLHFCKFFLVSSLPPPFFRPSLSWGLWSLWWVCYSCPQFRLWGIQGIQGESTRGLSRSQVLRQAYWYWLTYWGQFGFNSRGVVYWILFFVTCQKRKCPVVFVQTSTLISLHKCFANNIPTRFGLILGYPLFNQVLCNLE